MAEHNSGAPIKHKITQKQQHRPQFVAMVATEIAVSGGGSGCMATIRAIALSRTTRLDVLHHVVHTVR